LKTKTHYEILGVLPNCKTEEIKAAYRRLAKTSHPDVSKKPKDVAEREFADINLAHDTLIDPAKRAQYDYALATREEEPPSTLMTTILEGMRDIFTPSSSKKAKRSRKKKASNNIPDVELDEIPDGCEIGEESFFE